MKEQKVLEHTQKVKRATMMMMMMLRIFRGRDLQVLIEKKSKTVLCSPVSKWQNVFEAIGAWPT